MLLAASGRRETPEIGEACRCPFAPVSRKAGRVHHVRLISGNPDAVDSGCTGHEIAPIPRVLADPLQRRTAQEMVAEFMCKLVTGGPPRHQANIDRDLFCRSG